MYCRMRVEEPQPRRGGPPLEIFILGSPAIWRKITKFGSEGPRGGYPLLMADRDPPSRLTRLCEASERGVRERAYAESRDFVKQASLSTK